MLGSGTMWHAVFENTVYFLLNLYSQVLKISIYYFVPSLFAGGQWYGVDITKEDISDNFEQCVWEPSIIKINALSAAAEAACMILSVDETIKSPKAGEPPMAGGGMGMGRGMGRPM